LDAVLHGTELRMTEVEVRAQAAVSEVTLDDYNMITDQDLSAEKEQGTLGREYYEYPGGYDDPAVGKRLAQGRLGELDAAGDTIAGATNAISVHLGTVFTLEGHPTRSGDYLVTTQHLNLRIDSKSAQGPAADAGAAFCELSVAALPYDLQFRPARRTP